MVSLLHIVLTISLIKCNFIKTLYAIVLLIYTIIRYFVVFRENISVFNIILLIALILALALHILLKDDSFSHALKHLSSQRSFENKCEKIRNFYDDILQMVPDGIAIIN